MKHYRAALCALLIAFPGFAETADTQGRVFFIPLASYNYIHLDNQTIHTPAAGFGVITGDYGKPPPEIHQTFFAMALYQPFFLTGAARNANYHKIDVMFEGGVERHKFQALFMSASDKPLTGGLHTFYTAAGYGYEFIRWNNLSFVLGAALAIGDFGITISNGEPLPVLPMPYVRLRLDTRWFDMSFVYFMTLRLSFAIAPESRIRFTADMSMDPYRGINDLAGDLTLWYRLFSKDSRLGDIAGAGIGVKNESYDFDLVDGMESDFEIQTSALFACFDFTVLRIEGGYVFDSRSYSNKEKIAGNGSGFYVSLQGKYKF